ncbi:cytochrome c [Bartonella sp. CDC_skunk]|uniref:Cytochrome c domain-containing protein n=2 Tax=Bartonella rochalimae ATCC BAA-1498 TaxID=685782 RepID=A0A067WES4_9HYPH|nr:MULTISPECIES: cytochrome c family protein [Bartonella]AQX17900.1 cytochrome c [Bartonella sp. A1379B]AQX20820.1 cytochrome c [Bartonella sp. CDC_skunk]AQX22413.1 cytochrome c [Bartonella sp. 11B]AQX24306.1 cytochrome c [Bartonella sp. 114]AQX24861.1 cytochrome c [Bartonella sp. Coyote22sub2]
MKRLTFIYLMCACLFLLIILVGIFTISDMISNDSVQHSSKITDNDKLKETQNISDKSLLLSDLLKQGDLENGRKIFRQCAICHASKPGGSNRVGPSLWEIVDRPFASIKNFSYSKVLRANSDKKWDFFTLDRYIQSPRQAFPGTIMSFRGIKNDQDRADLLLYLRSLSDYSVPLPEDDE